MSKYEKIWKYIKDFNEDTLTLTFVEIGAISDVSIDHSFLQKKRTEVVRLAGWENFHEGTKSDI